MWLARQNGGTTGPYGEDEIGRLARAGALHSLDRISEDGINWIYFKDSPFWSGLAQSRMENLRLAQREPPNAEKQAHSMARKMKECASPGRKSRSLVLPSACVAFIACVATAIWTAIPRGRNAAAQDGAVAGCCAIVKTDLGSGTAFLVEMDGGTYLLSNHHVFYGTQMPQCSLPGGAKLKLGEFSLAKDRDLARFRVLDSGIKPLRQRSGNLEIGEEVTSYGNSLGGGVVTRNPGSVLGIGPEKIETSAEIVPGNSGGPLVDSMGRVAAVATYISLEAPDGWTVKETRYGKTRRFALRIPDADWLIADREKYQKQVAAFEETKSYIVCIAKMARDAEFVPFDDEISRNFAPGGYRFRENLASLAGRKRHMVRELASARSSGRETGGEIAAEHLKFMQESRKHLLAGLGVLDETDWIAPQMIHGNFFDDGADSVNGWRRFVSSAASDISHMIGNFNGIGGK